MGSGGGGGRRGSCRARVAEDTLYSSSGSSSELTVGYAGAQKLGCAAGSDSYSIHHIVISQNLSLPHMGGATIRSL